MKTILCLVLFLSSSMASAHHLNLTTWCEEPCLVKSHTSPLQQLVKQLFAELDIEVTIEVKPAERSLIDANAGLTDGEFARVDIIGDIYPNLIRVDVPLYQMDIAVLLI